ncbi:MAG: hypothetical protein AB7O66_08910 [Limisphaerales bacterium]
MSEGHPAQENHAIRRKHRNRGTALHGNRRAPVRRGTAGTLGTSLRHRWIWELLLSFQLFTSHVGSAAIARLAVGGDLFPGVDEPFRFVMGPLLNDRGDVAFLGNFGSPSEALVLIREGEAHPIVRTSSPSPDSNGNLRAPEHRGFFVATVRSDLKSDIGLFQHPKTMSLSGCELKHLLRTVVIPAYQAQEPASRYHLKR